MTTVDILIVYLAFGSPLAVYRYLETRGAKTSRRISHAVFALFFWIPSVIRIGYRYLTNADFIDAFVSRNDLDSSGRSIADLCDGLTSELVSIDRTIPLYDVREALDRYVGLSIANGSNLHGTPDVSTDLFAAAGHANDALAAVCLMRRNRRRLHRHHIRARLDFLTLFENRERGGMDARPRLLRLGIDLAGRLDDREAVDALTTLANLRGEVWNSETQKLAPGNTSATVAPLSMQTLPLNND